jgi:radical SAM protein with 4Fe4S-binding SPASM domain
MLAKYFGRYATARPPADPLAVRGIDGSVDYDHLVYVRVFEGCNLKCLHCFIPHNPKRLDISDLARVPDQVRSFAGPGDRILLQWHGGEPTVFGPEWLDAAIREIESGGSEFTWVHRIQTNLINYGDSPDWPRLYRDRFDSHIGISWDPGIRYLQGSSDRYESEFWRNVCKVHANGLKPFLVVTGTKVFFDRFKNPFDFFERMESEGVEHVHIERVTRTGSAREHWDVVGLNNLDYSRNMSRFALAYLSYRSRRGGGMFLSPFDGLLESVISLRSKHPSGYGCWSGACDTRFHTIDADGYRLGCTALTADPAFRDESGISIVSLHELRSSRTRSCDACQYRPICSSGCHATPLRDDSGECSGGYQLFSAVNRFVHAREVQHE